MRLYLSSSGLGRTPEKLLDLVGPGRRAAIIANAGDDTPAGRAEVVAKQTAVFADLGFAVRELDLRRCGDLDAVLQDIDLLWATGGNTFLLRRALAMSGLDRRLPELLARDALVCGGYSAGSVVMGPTLNGLHLMDDPNAPAEGHGPEVIWSGLGVIPFQPAVHYQSGKPESLRMDRIIAFYDANGIPYRPLRNGEVLIVRDGAVEHVI